MSGHHTTGKLGDSRVIAQTSNLFQSSFICTSALASVSTIICNSWIFSNKGRIYWKAGLPGALPKNNGARFEIESEHKENFRTGQLLGMQFTPMSYQKPLLLESHVKYAEEQSDNRYFRIGVEFLGLEASPEGRHILDRILEVISQYETMNAQENACPKGS